MRGELKLILIYEYTCTNCGIVKYANKRTDFSDTNCNNCNSRSFGLIRYKLIKSDKWIVFWFKGGRIGSVELNDANWIEVKKTFIYDLIQTDVTGTVHLNLYGIKSTNKLNKANGSK